MNTTADVNEPECPICLCVFREPKITFCGHIMCKECLVAWQMERGMEAACPLCRHTIFETTLQELPIDVLAKSAVDLLPTDQVFKATARGKINITPEMCPYCEDLLCSSRSSPNPNCPGPQEEKTTEQREVEAHEIIKDLSDKVDIIVEVVNNTHNVFKELEEDFRGQVDMDETEKLVQDQVLQYVEGLTSQTGRLRTVLLMHQHLLKRMQDSQQVLAIILMRKPMQDRVVFLGKKMAHLIECGMDNCKIGS